MLILKAGFAFASPAFLFLLNKSFYFIKDSQWKNGPRPLPHISRITVESLGLLIGDS